MKDLAIGLVAFVCIAIGIMLSEPNPPEWLVRSLIIGTFYGLIGGAGLWFWGKWRKRK